METPLPAATAALTAQDDPTSWRVDDAWWALLEPILRRDTPRKQPGRPRRDDRASFDGVIWLARTGAQWSPLPRECGPQSPVHERFRAWMARGALARAWAVLRRGRRGDRAGWGRASRRWRHRHGPVRHQGGAGEAQATGRHPTDRGKTQRVPRTTRHLVTEATGMPTAVPVTGATRHAMTHLAALRDGTVVASNPPETPPLARDRGDDGDACREAASARGDTAHSPPTASAERPLPPPGHPDRHPPRRWLGAVPHRWCNRCRRLLTRTEKHASHDLGCSQIAAVLIIYRKIRHARLLSG